MWKIDDESEWVAMICCNYPWSWWADAPDNISKQRQHSNIPASKALPCRRKMTHDGAPTWSGSSKFEPRRWNFYCRSCVNCDRGGETSAKLRVTARSTTKVWVWRNFGTQFWNQFNFFGIMYIISISHHIISYIISPKLSDFFNSAMKVELYFQLFPLMYALHNEPTVTAVGFEADDFCQIILMMNLLATCLIWFVIAWGILFLFRNQKYSQINDDQFRQIHRITETDPQEYFLQSVFWENVIARVIGSFWMIF